MNDFTTCRDCQRGFDPRHVYTDHCGFPVCIDCQEARRAATQEPEVMCRTPLGGEGSLDRRAKQPVKQPISRNLTPAQARVKTFIAAHIAEHSASPTYGQIALGTGRTSRGNVCRIVACLVVRGHLRRRKPYARSLQMVER